MHLHFHHLPTRSVWNPFPQVEVMGSVEEGILAACWSPDAEVLVLVTGEGFWGVFGTAWGLNLSFRFSVSILFKYDYEIIHMFQ